MSLTKHVGGHSDLMMGSRLGRRGALPPAARSRAQTLGQVVSPDDAALALRGLRTLGVRLERETASALAIAEWLAGRPEVAHVLCPMLPGAPGHELWQRDFTGGCGLFSFVLAGGDAAARARFIDALELFGIGYSLGRLREPGDPVRPGPRAQRHALAARRLEPGRPARGQAVDRARRPGGPDARPRARLRGDGAA